MTLPGPPMRPRGGWDSASIFSPWITCGRGRVSRWSGATLTPRSSPSRALSVSEHGRAVFEFLALLDRAAIWAARGHVRDALAAIEAARLSWPGPGRCCWRGLMNWRHWSTCRSVTCTPPLSWPAGYRPPAAACCWPRSRSPPVITTPRKKSCRQRRWPS
jgi:hypothetical protein